MDYSRMLNWRRGCYVLIGIVILQFLFALSGTRSGSSNAALSGISSSSEKLSAHDLPVNIHGEILDALTEEQCNDAFPDLYYHVNETVSYWKQRDQIISPADVDISWRTNEAFTDLPGGGIRFMIYDNELRILETVSMVENFLYTARGLGVLSLLQRAVESATAGKQKLPTIEAAIVLQDISDPPTPDGTHTFWTFTSHVNNETHLRAHWLIPDFDSWSTQDSATGSYKDARRRASEHDAPFLQKIQQIVWRGTVWLSPKIRQPLIDATKDQAWADVEGTTWENNDNKIRVDQLCKYAMTIHTEGWSYSGRLKFLYNCNSLTFIHDLEWDTYFYHLLQADGPHQNYVPVKNDFSDLESKVKYYFDHPQEAEVIIANADDQFRSKYLSDAATSCYLRKLMQGYSTVAFVPEVDRPLGEGDEVAKRRGISYEEFLFLHTDVKEEGQGSTTA